MRHWTSARPPALLLLLLLLSFSSVFCLLSYIYFFFFFFFFKIQTICVVFPFCVLSRPEGDFPRPSPSPSKTHQHGISYTHSTHTHDTLLSLQPVGSSPVHFSLKIEMKAQNTHKIYRLSQDRRERFQKAKHEKIKVKNKPKPTWVSTFGHFSLRFNEDGSGRDG